MRIDHGLAISLENTVRSVYQCDRAGMGGYIDADHFEAAPFDAALIALAPLWQKGDLQEIEGFLYKWEHCLRGESDESVDVEAYIDELDQLIALLKSR